MRPLLHLLLLFGLGQLPLPSEPLLTVDSPTKAIAFTPAGFAALPRTECTVPDPHTKVDHHFSGVAVRELLTQAGAPLGAALRGPALQLVVLVRAADGYAVVFSLADFDEAFGNRIILLADRDDGKPLEERHGPLRLVVQGDQKAARWIRQVKSIEVVSIGDIAPRPPAKPAP